MAHEKTDKAVSQHLLALYRQAVFPARLVALGWVAGAAAWLPPARLRVWVLAAYDRWEAGKSRNWWRMQVLALVVMAAGLALVGSSIWERVMTQGTTPPDSSRTAPVAASVLPLDVGQPSMPTRHSQVSAEIPEVSRTVEKPRKLPNTQMQPGNTRSPKKTKKEAS
ncbi:MAG: hypothetical protein K1Y36_30835 [Blastocatellia bacterium]|nr:hypothetical protein [Blastocatellia bacterium]